MAKSDFNWEFSAPAYYDLETDDWTVPDDGYFGEFGGSTDHLA
jgi:hypothetical protein